MKRRVRSESGSIDVPWNRGVAVFERPGERLASGVGEVVSNATNTVDIVDWKRDSLERLTPARGG